MTFVESALEPPCNVLSNARWIMIVAHKVADIFVLFWTIGLISPYYGKPQVLPWHWWKFQLNLGFKPVSSLFFSLIKVFSRKSLRQRAYVDSPQVYVNVLPEDRAEAFFIFAFSIMLDAILFRWSHKLHFCLVTVVDWFKKIERYIEYKFIGSSC